MMNTKQFLERLEERITRKGEDGKRVVDLIKWYAYECIQYAKKQSNENLSEFEREDARNMAYIYCHRAGASLNTLRTFNLVFVSEIEKFVDNLIKIISIYRFK